ncbi:MAG: alpha/beta hydrolase [Planctomycetota bacterium]
MIAVFSAWWAVGLLVADVATSPHPRKIAPRQRLFGRPVESVEVCARDGVVARGWLLEADVQLPSTSAAKRCVILAAGIRGDRRAMQSRAPFYLDRGWSTLLVDLRGTGESEPTRIAMGYHEALDLLAFARDLRGRGFVQIGLHGQSLGAAAAVYTAVRAGASGAAGASSQTPLAWRFVVLEACYRDIRAALSARMLGLPGFLLYPIVASAEWLLSVDADALDPVSAIAALDAPLFVACGDRDSKVGSGASEALLAASPARDKVRHDVVGAGHVDLWAARGGNALRSALADFLSRR